MIYIEYFYGMAHYKKCPYCPKKNVTGRHVATCVHRPETAELESPRLPVENEPEISTAGRPLGSKNRKTALKAYQAEIDQELLRLALGKPEVIECPECKAKIERKARPDREALIHLDNRLKGKIGTKANESDTKPTEISNSDLIVISKAVFEIIDNVNSRPIDGLLEQVKAMPIKPSADLIASTSTN